MSMDRRALLKGLAFAGAGSAVAPSPSHASEAPEAPADAVGMLYDANGMVNRKQEKLGDSAQFELDTTTKRHWVRAREPRSWSIATVHNAHCPQPTLDYKANLSLSMHAVHAPRIHNLGRPATYRRRNHRA